MNLFVLNAATAQDCLPQLREVADKVRGCRDITIRFPTGEWHWRYRQAEEDMAALLSGTLQYDTHWGKLGIGFNKGVVFEEVENLTIEGDGSLLIMYGLIAPFTFKNCRNVCIRNLTINWNRPPFTPCHIVAVAGERVTLRPFSGFTLQGGEPIWALNEYEPHNQRMGVPWRFRVKDRMHCEPDGTAWFSSDMRDGSLTAGHDLIVRHIGNYRPVFHLLGGSDFTFERVTLHAGPGMGLVAHYTKNVTLRRLEVLPFAKRMMSTNTDATHFISCDGLIDAKDCYFEGMGDDAINVHGFYNSITELLDERTVRVTIQNMNGTQDLVFDTPSKGSAVEFSKYDNLLPFAGNQVEAVSVSKSRWEAVIQFEYPLDKAIRVGDLLTDCTRVAALRFVNCHIRAIRARAALVQTRQALVSNCLIEDCTGTGIHLDTATGWYESIGTRNVVLRQNHIRRCGYGDGTYCDTAGIAVTTECPENAVGVHKELLIEDNNIECEGKNGIFVSCTDGVTIRGNTITDCQNAVLLECCDHVRLEKNQTEGGILLQQGGFGFQELGV